MCVLYRLQFGTVNDWYHPSHVMHPNPTILFTLQERRQTEIKNNGKQRLEMGRVERHDHQKTRDETCTRQGNDPSREDESNLLPVHSLEIEVAERNTDSGTSQTLSGGDGESETRGEEYGDGSAQFHAEATSGRDLCNLVAESTDDMVAIKPETDTEQKTGNDENPDRSVGFLGDNTGGVSVVGTNPGSNSVGNCDM